MSTTTKQTGCAARSWKLATIGGVVVAILGMTLLGWGVVMSIVIGVVVAGGGGVWLTRMMCQDADTAESAPVATTPEPETETRVVEQPEVTSVAAPIQSLVKPSTVLPGQVELVARKGTWRYQGAAG